MQQSKINEEKMRLLVMTLAILITGCAGLSQNGQQVRLASQVGSNCEFIGATEASIWVNKGDNQLKNQAAKMGGNWVVVTGYKWEGAFIGNRPSSGDVYKCPHMAGSARVVDKTVDLNINSSQQGSIPEPSDVIFENLKKLKKLKEEGIITEEEYKSKKAALLDKL